MCGICVVWFEIFSKFESVGVCALGGRIDLSPGSSREIGASGEGGLRHDDADALKPDDEYARLELDDDNALNVGLKPGCKYDAALLLMKILCSTQMMMLFSNFVSRTSRCWG